MKYINKKIKDIKIAYIGGGSSKWGLSLIVDFALEETISGHVKLYDPAFDYAKDNAIIGNKLTSRKDIKGKWNYSVVNNLEEALKDAEFVIISILPSSFKEMTSDVHTPEKYGIYQSVGDTTGPAGLMRALRTIPIYFKIAKAIKKKCPNAWVINYTNPMGLCLYSLYHIFPEIKAFGCCSEIFKMQDLLLSMLDDMLNIKNAKRDQIKLKILGINHFAWISKASYQNIDLFPIYSNFVNKYKNEGFSIPGDETWEQNVFKSANLVKFDLYNKFGIMAAADDRHLAEFFPGKWYLKNLETIKKWKFRLTPVEFRINRKNKINEYRKNIILGVEKIKLEPKGIECLRLIKAILGLGDIISNVNIPNYGQIKNIPLGTIVETNVLFKYNDFSPIYSGAIPSNIYSYIMRIVLNHNLILEASILKNKDIAFKAFINDPLVSIKTKKAKELFNEMLLNIKIHLKGWKI